MYKRQAFLVSCLDCLADALLLDGSDFVTVDCVLREVLVLCFASGLETLV